MNPAACRLCEATRIKCLGAIPDSDYFAGRVLRDPIHGGRLWKCDSCQSMFRHPVLPNSEYLRLYRNGTEDEWSADVGRQDLATIRRIIAEKGSPCGVLDVGCGAGDFLLTLPSDLARYGVEPSVAASAIARKRGVSILAPTLDGLSPTASFDVITLIDVIEHVVEPGALLDAALSHLAPGGSLIIATGDPSNVPWSRVFRSRFWYSSFPEHITFPSLKYFYIWHEGKGLRAPTAEKLRYRRMPFWKTAIYFASQAVFLASPSLLSLVGRRIDGLRRAPKPRRRFFSPGAPGVFADHQIVTIQSPSARSVAMSPAEAVQFLPPKILET
jgi:SAM-dependent methyltransferase